MKKRFQLIALLAVALLGACSVHSYRRSRGKEQHSSFLSGTHRQDIGGSGRPRVQRSEAGQHG